MKHFVMVVGSQPLENRREPMYLLLSSSSSDYCSYRSIDESVTNGQMMEDRANDDDR